MRYAVSGYFRLWVGVVLALLGMAWLVGCTIAGKHGTSEPSGPIDTLVMLTAPAAVDIAPPLGPDGIAMRIYATSSSNSRALPIKDGRLEVLMFDGVINDQTPASVTPLHVWTRTPAELRPFANKSPLGTSYLLTLEWGQDRPHQPNITIVARYITAAGQVIYSAPSTIPVGDNPGPTM